MVNVTLRPDFDCHVPLRSGGNSCDITREQKRGTANHTRRDSAFAFMPIKLYLQLGRCNNIESENGGMREKATFAAGCFWGIEVAFRELPGVLDVASGYEGGHTANPTYKDVCTDRTGHAETVEVEYDPAQITYDRLLETFWTIHDPTQVNRQGPDVGTQYRSAIFFHTPEQEQAARASKAQLEASGRFRRPIATQIESAQTFYRAEEYHQQYLSKRGLKHCHI